MPAYDIQQNFTDSRTLALESFPINSTRETNYELGLG
jgi:hypothetical protein